MDGAKYSRSYSRVDLRRTGPKITVTIGHPKATRALAHKKGVELQKPLRVEALIDTGASRTVINPQVAASRGLQQTGLVRISSAGHITERQEFVGAIHFPGQQLREFDPTSLVACPLPEQDVSCLLGRDVLERWSLMYDGRSGLVEVEE
jgi:predicted aspartyl protease